MIRRFIVSGRVQGVGFRWYTSRVARELGLSGFVRNLDDGRVEVVAEGGEAALQELVVKLQQGPRGAVVSAVIMSEAERDVDMRNGFTIQ